MTPVKYDKMSTLTKGLSVLWKPREKNEEPPDFGADAVESTERGWGICDGKLWIKTGVELPKVDISTGELDGKFRRHRSVLRGGRYALFDYWNLLIVWVYMLGEPILPFLPDRWLPAWALHTNWWLVLAVAIGVPMIVRWILVRLGVLRSPWVKMTAWRKQLDLRGVWWGLLILLVPLVVIAWLNPKGQRADVQTVIGMIILLFALLWIILKLIERAIGLTWNERRGKWHSLNNVGENAVKALQEMPVEKAT